MGHTREVQLGANVNAQAADGGRPLQHKAAQEGRAEVVAQIVEVGADLNVTAHRWIEVDALNDTQKTRGGDGHAGCSWELTSIVQSTAAMVTRLLEAGADLHRRSHVGDTPLFQAVLQGWSELSWLQCFCCCSIAFIQTHTQLVTSY